MGLKYRIKQHFRENITQYIIILSIFIFGFIFGFFNVKGLDDQVKTHLASMLDNYLKAGIEGDLYGRNIFINAFIKQIETLLSIWLLGLTVIGLPLILVVVFLRALSVGFTVGFLFQEKAGAAVILSLVSVLPQNLVYIPCLLFAAIIAMNFSVDIVRNKGSGNSLGLALLSYSIVMLLIVIIFALGAFIEAYLSPWMLSWFR